MAVEERETITEEEAAPALSVSAAMGLAKNALEEVVVRLVGEVSEVNDKPGYKAVYFTVKDEKASLPCMMWMNRYQASGVALSVGALVELTGRFSLYAAKGRMNFDVFSVSLAGEGQLRLQVANLARELEAMGLMDPARKRPLPAYPETIGLVTSPRGAAVHDVLRTLRRRYPLARILFAGVPVEGPGAADGLVDGLAKVVFAGAEVVLLVRGGGSFEDLMPFNDRRLARTIAACPVPVVTGIGHEPDTSIADMVADLRAATPSHAAQLLWPERQWHAQLVDDLEANLLEAAERRLSQADQRLDTLGRALAWLSPERGLARLEERFGTLARRLDFALEQKLERTDARLRFLEAGMSRYAESRVLDTRLEQTAALTRRLRQAQALRLEQIGGRLDTASSRLEERFARQFEGLERQLERHDLRLRGLDPEGPLERGYAYAFTADGHFVRSIRDVQPGASLTVKIRDGEADTRVTAVRATGESHDIP